MSPLQAGGKDDERAATREERRSVWLKDSLLLLQYRYWGGAM
jgi:hypothetical protein